MAGERDDAPARLNHAEIFRAIRDLDRKFDTDSRERREVEAKLFDEIKGARKDLGDQIDGVKGQAAALTATIARLEGERAGERSAIEAAGHVQAAASSLSTPHGSEPATVGWQRFGLWAAIIAAVVGILGGFGQALHFVVSASSAIYQASKSTPPS